MFNKPISRRKFIKTTLVLGAGTAVADAFWFEKYYVETSEHYLGNATRDSNNIKIIQVSDLHLQSVGGKHERLAHNINELKPDLIVFTGDAIDKAKNISELDKFLGLLNNDIQKAAILGNWEYWGRVNQEELSQVYAKYNGDLLINRSRQFLLKNKMVSISGVDDHIAGNADIEETLRSYLPGDYHIILNHCPAYSDQIAKLINDTPADFILSGHTHGGQLNIFGFAPFLPPGCGKYVRGWYNENNPKMYVSKGIGTSIFPARFGSRAEIAVFNLLA